jgi:hypothetical protein
MSWSARFVWAGKDVRRHGQVECRVARYADAMCVCRLCRTPHTGGLIFDTLTNRMGSAIELHGGPIPVAAAGVRWQCNGIIWRSSACASACPTLEGGPVGRQYHSQWAAGNGAGEIERVDADTQWNAQFSVAGSVGYESHSHVTRTGQVLRVKLLVDAACKREHGQEQHLFEEKMQTPLLNVFCLLATLNVMTTHLPMAISTAL